MRAIVKRSSIKKKYLIEMLSTETHHDHEIVMGEGGDLYWLENKAVRESVDKIGLLNIYELFESLGMNYNSEIIRKMYRDKGYSLFGYWEIFYCETNNEIANKYKPTNKL